MRLNQGMRSKLTYANVVSTLALCFAVGGGFAVAGTLVGNSKDVAPQAIKNSDVKKNTLTSDRLKDGAAVSANDVIPDALGGAAIDESSLGDVPSALSAQSATNATNAENAANADHANTADTAGTASNATKVGGLQVVKFSHSGRVPATTILNLAGLSLTYGCTDIGGGAFVGTLLARTAVDDAKIYLTRTANNNATSYQSDASFNSTETFNVGGGGVGTAVYARPSGEVVTVDFQTTGACNSGLNAFGTATGG